MGCAACVAGEYSDTTDATPCKASACAGTLTADALYDGLDLPSLTPMHCAVKAGGANGNCAAATTSTACATASTAGAVTGAANACEFTAGASTATQDCRTCPAGKFGAGTSRATCTKCVAGEYQNERGQGACKAMTCCTGTFSDETGQTSTKGSCKKCAAGRYQDEKGKTACLGCALGKFTKDKGRAACAPMYCKVGEFIKRTASQVAAADAKVVTAATLAAAADEAATVAAKVADDAAAAAVLAALGHAVATSCEACAVGKYTNTGAIPTIGTTCKNARCTAGSSIAIEGQDHGDDDCTSCVTGKHTANGGIEQCKSCLDVKMTDFKVSSTLPFNPTKNDPAVNNKPNDITVEFTANAWVADNTQIVVSGLTDSGTPTGALALTGDSAKHYGSSGAWDKTEGTLTLTLQDQTLVSHDSVKTCKSLTNKYVLNMGHNAARELLPRSNHAAMVCKRGKLKAGAVIDVARYTAATCTKAPTTTTTPGTCGADDTTATSDAGFTACKVWSKDVILAAGGGVLTVVMAADKITSITVKTTGTELWTPGSTITLTKASLGYVENTKGPDNDIVVTLAEADLDLCLTGCGAKTYTGVAGSSAAANDATFDVTLNEDTVTSIKVNTHGTGYKVNDVVTISRTALGAVDKKCYSFKAAFDLPFDAATGVAFLGTADMECEASKTTAADMCKAYEGTGLDALTGTTKGQIGTWTPGAVTGGIAKCTQLATKVGIAASTHTRSGVAAVDATSTSTAATFDFVFSETKLTKVTVNAVGAGVKVADVFTFTKDQLGYKAPAGGAAGNGPTNSYKLTVTAAMLVGVQGPDADLTFTLTEADLECAIPHGDATALMPMGAFTSAQTSTSAWVPVPANDYRKQSITFSLLNPAGFSGPKTIKVAVKSDGSSTAALTSSDSSGDHHTGEPLLESLSIADDQSSQALGDKNLGVTDRMITVKFTINLEGAATVTNDAVFQIEGLKTTTAAGDVTLSGASASLFSAKMVQSCDLVQTTLELTSKSDISKANSAIELSFTLKTVSYGFTGGPIAICSTSIVTTGAHTATYSITATPFPLAEASYVLKTKSGASEKIKPERVVFGKASVTLEGVTAGVESGLTSGATCESLVLGSGASSSQTNGNTAGLLATTIPFAVSSLPRANTARASSVPAPSVARPAISRPP
jgi:hypothetical protein